jgi:hypothetical protein
MRIAIGLIGLGVAAGVIPTGLAGIAHAGAVVGGTAAALVVLVTVCLAAPALGRWRSGTTHVRANPAPFNRTVPLSRSPARGI